jgi:hypothetical protein
MDPRAWCDPNDPIPDAVLSLRAERIAILAPCGQLLVADDDWSWTVTDTLAEPAFEAGRSGETMYPMFSPNGRLALLRRAGVVTVVDVYEGVVGELAFDEILGFAPRPSARAGMVAWTCRERTVAVADPGGARDVLDDVDCDTVAAATQAPVLVAFDAEGNLVGVELETSETYETAYNDAAHAHRDDRERSLKISADGRVVAIDIYDVISAYPVRTGIVELPNMQILYSGPTVRVPLSEEGHGLLLPPGSDGQRRFWTRDNELPVVPAAADYEVLDRDHVVLIDPQELGQYSVAIWNARDDELVYLYRPASFRWVNSAQDGVAEVYEIHQECDNAPESTAGCEAGTWQLRLWLPHEGLGPIRRPPPDAIARGYSSAGDILTVRRIEPGPPEPQRRDSNLEYIVVGPDDEELGRWVAPSTAPVSPSVQFVGADERAAYLFGYSGPEIGLVALDRGGPPRQLLPGSSFAQLDARLRVAVGPVDDTVQVSPTQPPM